jgi:tRNA(Ile)-lysidine synthase
VPEALTTQVLHRVRAKNLLRAGERIGVALSGGADSVSLLRALLELRSELGVVLKVVHFNHGIRGADSDADEEFVKALAERFELEFIRSSGDTKTYAKQNGLSLETAARVLRYEFFMQTIENGAVNKIATAHTLDDQAETLLLRLVRGTGLQGMCGIHTETQEGIVRPLLCVHRAEVEAYLQQLGQEWREDHSNEDVRHMRNRMRHELMPMLARDYNPKVKDALARTSDLLAADEEFMAEQTAKMLPIVLMPGKPVRGGGRAVNDDSLALSVEKLNAQPLALQRRLIRAVAERINIGLDMQQVETALTLRSGAKLTISPDWQITRTARELRFERSTGKVAGYSRALTVPGKAEIPEMNIVVHARVIPLDSEKSRGTLDAQNLSPSAALVVRNWRAGDRFLQAFASREHKVKELLDEVKPPPELRAGWPVIEAGGQIVWMRGARNPRLKLPGGEELRIEIEELG